MGNVKKTWQITEQKNKKKVQSLKPTNHPKNRPVAPKEERIVSQPPWLSWAKMLVIRRTYKSVIEDHLFLTPHVICTRVKTPHISLGDKLIPPWKIRASLFNEQFLNPLKSVGFMSLPSSKLTYPILKMIFLFLRWDMLIPWRVSPTTRGNPKRRLKSPVGPKRGRSFFRCWTMLRSRWPRRKAWILMEAASSPEGMDSVPLTITLPETNISRPWKLMVGRWAFPFRMAYFSGFMLVSGRVAIAVPKNWFVWQVG